MTRYLKEYLRNKKWYNSEWRCKCLLLSAWRDYQENWCNCGDKHTQLNNVNYDLMPETRDWYFTLVDKYLDEVIIPWATIQTQDVETFKTQTKSLVTAMIDVCTGSIINPIKAVEAYNSWQTLEVWATAKWYTLDTTGTYTEDSIVEISASPYLIDIKYTSDANDEYIAEYMLEKWIIESCS